MAAITHGMNPDEVEGLATELDGIADQIRGICNQLNARVNQTTWEGPDARMFKGDWWPGHQTNLMRVADDLAGFGQSARNNASEQRNASGQ